MFLVTRFDIDLAATWESLKASNPYLLVLAVLVHYTTFIFRGVRWRLLLRSAQETPEGPVPGTLHCGSLILLGWFTNSVTWFRLGDAYRAYAYAEDTGGSFPRTMGTILAERALDIALVFLLLAFAALFLAASGISTPWVFVGLAATVVAILAGVILIMERFRARLIRILPGALSAAYQRFHEGAMGSFRSHLLLVTLLGLLGWLAEVGRLFLVLEALGYSLNVPLIIFVTLAGAMLTWVPITPGGLGAVELGVTRLLILSSTIQTEAAVSIVAIDRSISWLSIIITGAAVLLGRAVAKRRRRKLTAADEALPRQG